MVDFAPPKMASGMKELAGACMTTFQLLGKDGRADLRKAALQSSSKAARQLLVALQDYEKMAAWKERQAQRDGGDDGD